MSMVKPIASKQNAFDATNNSIFYFTSSGGNQVVGNRLVIRDNSNNTEIYNEYVETYQFAHTVPANTLTNGEYYNFYFVTYDINDNASPNSNVVPFYCYTQPTVTFTNITEGGLVNANKFTFNFTYSQTESELLDKIVVYLYDSVGNQIAQSDNIYSANIPPISLSYTFDGFEDNGIYKIKAKGTTINGQEFESSLISFNVRYFYPSVFNNIVLFNDCTNGYIKVENNLVAIDGITNIEPIVYGDHCLEIDSFGQYVRWQDGFALNNSDFLLSLWLKPYGDGTICLLKDKSNSRNYYQISLYKNVKVSDTDYTTYFELLGYENGVLKTRLYSNRLSQNITNLDDLAIKIRHNNNTWETVLTAVSYTHLTLPTMAVV